MASLLDIAPRAEFVSVRGAMVEVTGVSAKGIVSLLSRFPDLRLFMVGRSPSPERLIETGGDAVAAIIAAGCGSPGDEQAETIAGRLSLDEQADLLAAIFRLTLPNGVGPFVDKLTALGAIVGAAGAEASPRAPATKSRK